jgi:hypothetical protein
VTMFISAVYEYDNRAEGTGDCIPLSSEQLKNLYSSPNIIIMIKSSWLRRSTHAGHEKYTQTFG